MCRCREAQGLCESDLGREFFRAQILPPHPQNVHQQHAEKKQQRDSAEQQAHKIRFAFFVAPGETVIRNDSGNREKYEIQHVLLRFRNGFGCGVCRIAGENSTKWKALRGF